MTTSPSDGSTAVVGAGVMGRGVALSLLLYGRKVVLVDLDEDVLDAARRELVERARLYPMMAPHLPRIAQADLVGALTLSPDLAKASHCDFVIENATEDWSVKRPIYRRLDALCAPGTIFAANTSAMPISRLAEETGRPERVIGMHFMNPAPLKRTVEVVRGARTSADTLETACALLAGIGKRAIVVNDSPGFVTNRVMMLMVNEAAAALHEGVASAEDIDQLFRECFGHRMGPLRTCDLIGIDTVKRSLDVLYGEFRHSKYLPCPLIVEMVESGRLGCKSGHGFFTYPSQPPSSRVDM